ncbi:MAG: DUF1697 domain-containing protein [Vicinamibacterales bacterium]
MALVAFLRGLNVGGHRRVRTTALARQLAHLDVVNIGAAGTLVVRRRVSQAALRAELKARLPVDAHVAICRGSDVVALVAQDHFGARRPRPDCVRFVSVLVRRPRLAPAAPLRLPASGRWLVDVLAHDGRFVVGVHRREMKAIGALAALDRLFGTPATARGWTTMEAVAKILQAAPAATRRIGSRRTARSARPAVVK